MQESKKELEQYGTANDRTQAGSSKNHSEKGYHSSFGGDAIDISIPELVQILWNKRKTIALIALFVTLLGTTISFITPNNYTSNIKLLPQLQSGGNSASNIFGKFNGLLNIGGSNSSAGEGLSLILYPQVIKSTPFHLHLLSNKIQHPANPSDTVTLEYYFSEVYDPPFLTRLFSTIKNLPKIIASVPGMLFSGNEKQGKKTVTNGEDTIAKRSIDDQPLKVTSSQRTGISELKSRVEASIADNGILSLYVTMPSAELSAQLNRMAVRYLTDYIVEYRTNKAKEDLNFIEERKEEAERKFIASQERLAAAKDNNLNINTELQRARIRRLELENKIDFEVYQQLAQQYEQSKIKLQEETPVFKVLEPIQIPNRKSSPNRELIIFTSIFLGVVLGILYVLTRHLLGYTRLFLKKG